MKKGLFFALAVVALCLLVLAGCRSQPEPPASVRARPQPVLDLAGRTYAFVASATSDLPPGAAAEGRPADLVLGNAFVRFVVSAVGHVMAGSGGGNVIDAAVQGGEDRMRLLVPELGARPPVWPVYETVKVEAPGGLGAPCVVAADGHLAGLPAVGVRTTYTLTPGSRALDIVTAVENRGDAVIKSFEFGDVLYQGRVLWYVPELGLCPLGKTGRAGWFCFFVGDLAWGLRCPAAAGMAIASEIGALRLHYVTADIAPGETRSYSRSLIAVAGGPQEVWLRAQPPESENASHLLLILEEDDTGQRVPGAAVTVTPREAQQAFMAWTGSDGEADMELPEGIYRVAVDSPGRGARGPVPLQCAAGKWHELRVTVPQAGEVLVQGRTRSGDYATPASVRLLTRRVSGRTPPLPGSPGFPLARPAEVTLTEGTHEARVPLAPSAPAPASYALFASKGPLFDIAAAPVEVSPGSSARLDMLLQRAVESGRYVAVDFRQHTEASPDCALSVQERLLADACEGLDGAVVSDPAFRVRFEEAPQDAECILVPGFRAEVPAVGSFSVFPLETVHEAGDELTSVVQPERAAADILGQMRRLQPDAVIQVDNPMDERTGYFALSGFDPTMGRHPPAAFSEDFDAIEILSGSDTGAAERLLPCWFHLLNEGRKVIVTGGSGSRGIMGDVAGIARTFVDCPRKGSRPTVQEMADAIRQLRQVPNAFVTNGPFIEVTLGGQTLGSVQSARAKSVQMRLRVLAPLWVDLTEVTVYRNGVVAEDFSLGPATEPLRCDRAMDLALDGDSWFVVCVRGKRAMDLVYGIRKRAPSAWAVTNPFWVDADGDGRLRFSP